MAVTMPMRASFLLRGRALRWVAWALVASAVACGHSGQQPPLAAPVVLTPGPTSPAEPTEPTAAWGNRFEDFGFFVDVPGQEPVTEREVYSLTPTSDIDGRTWVVYNAEQLCSGGLKEQFRPSPTTIYPLGDSLTYRGPLNEEALTCLNELHPARLALWSSQPGDFHEWTWLRHLLLMHPSDDHALSLSRLTSLQTLVLKNGRIREAGLSHLAALTSLHTLEVFDNYVEAAGLRHLTTLTALRTLKFESSGVGDEGLQVLSELTSLQVLDLSYTDVTDAGLPYLATLTSLRSLDLSVTQVSDAGIAHLSGLTSLHTLGLSNTQVTQSCPPSFPQLRCHSR